MAPLFLVLTLGLASTGKASELYTCRLLAHQVHCQKIETLKTNETYQLRLCINNKCSAKVTFSFRCCAICEACKTILASDAATICTKDEKKCEEELDTFLNNLCASGTLDSTTPQPTSSSETTTAANTYMAAVTALGILFGLSICTVLLLVVTVGWMCTRRTLKIPKQKELDNALEGIANRTVEESTGSGEEVEKRFNNPLYEDSMSLHYQPQNDKRESTNLPSPPAHEESNNENGIILNITTAEIAAPSSDNAKEQYQEIHIYDGRSDFQADRYYERENYDCSQDDDDDNDRLYDALEQRSSPDRDTVSDSGSNARHEDDENASRTYDHPMVRYDAVNHPCNEEEEDYDVLDHDIHVGGMVAASNFERDEEKYFKNQQSPCLAMRDIRASTRGRAVHSFQEDSGDYDVLEPNSDVVATISQASRDREKVLKSSLCVGEPNVIAARRDLPVAKYENVNFTNFETDGADNNILDRKCGANGQAPVRR